jgi:hypothetical protein
LPVTRAIRLLSLPAEGVASLVHGLLGDPISPEFIEAIVRRGEGNPVVTEP